MPECIVVGGGVIGLLTARALYKAGVDVLLLERGVLGGESTWAGGGIISPLYPWRYADAVNRLAERSKQIYPQLIPALYEESGIDSELLNSGLFVLAHEGIDAIQQWGERWSINMEYVSDHRRVRELEPQVAENVAEGIWLPDIMQVRNPKLARAFKGSFDALGIAYREHCPVSEIIVSGSKVTGVRTDAGILNTDRVVIASGAWSARFAPAKKSVAVLPVKGQMIMYKGEPGLLRRMVLSEGHYVIPRKDGHILAGSTLEKIGFDKTISSEALGELQQAANTLIPALAGLPVARQWAGLRPGTENGIPYICRHDELEGLYIHAGHYRNGIVLGAASAELMAALVLERETEIELAPYAINAMH
ncbi:MAG TPA: glycine oxidase ThiO [Thiotrichales bacterium]|nr:glycine oxidase ThiO [Thiotrichales bacterium]